jgi:hypothetical protein
LSGNSLFNLLAYGVEEQRMGFLNAGTAGALNDNGMVGQVAGFAPIAAKQSHPYHTTLAGNLQCGQDVGRVSAGAETNQHIPRSRQGHKLTSEYLSKPEVVGNAGHCGNIVVQANSREGTTISTIATEHFLGQVQRICCTPPIPAGKEGLPTEQGLTDHLVDMFNLFGPGL